MLGQGSPPRFVSKSYLYSLVKAQPAEYRKRVIISRSGKILLTAIALSRPAVFVFGFPLTRF